MKKDNDDKKIRIAAKALEGLLSATDLSGQVQQHHELIKALQTPPAHESLYENRRPQKSLRELAIEKVEALNSVLSQGHDIMQKENELKKIKQQDMSTKNEMLSQIKKNTSDITSKSEALKKELNDNKKDITPTKKDMVVKKFSETKKEVAPSKKEILAQKFSENKKEVTPSKREILAEKFKENKKDILGDKGSDDKTPDKIKTEFKPDKPKLR